MIEDREPEPSASRDYESTETTLDPALVLVLSYLDLIASCLVAKMEGGLAFLSTLEAVRAEVKAAS